MFRSNFMQMILCIETFLIERKHSTIEPNPALAYNEQSCRMLNCAHTDVVQL